jgi:hypothetical protein
VRSPRGLVPLLGWLAATLTSIVLASVAMLPVLRTATSNDGALVSADGLRDSGNADPIPLPSLPSMTAPSTTEDPPAEETTPVDPAEAPERPDEETAEPTTRPPATTTRPTTRPPAAAREPAPTVENGWTVTTDGNGAKTYLQSFRTDGGQAVIRISNGVVQLVTATPSDGFEVATVQNSPDNLAVYFNEVNHSFIVHTVWNVDRPVAQVTEVGN